MNNNLADTSKLAESFFITRNGLSPNDKPFYHISDCLQPLISGILDRHGNAGMTQMFTKKPQRVMIAVVLPFVIKEYQNV